MDMNIATFRITHQWHPETKGGTLGYTTELVHGPTEHEYYKYVFKYCNAELLLLNILKTECWLTCKQMIFISHTQQTHYVHLIVELSFVPPDEHKFIKYLLYFKFWHFPETNMRVSIPYVHRLVCCLSAQQWVPSEFIRACRPSLYSRFPLSYLNQPEHLNSEIRPLPPGHLHNYYSLSSLDFLL